MLEALLDREQACNTSNFRTEAPGLPLTKEDLEVYLDDLARKGRAAGTLDVYRRNVYALYDDLPDNKTVLPGMLAKWKKKLQTDGYSPRTINIRVSVANGLMAFMGRRDLQAVGSLEVDTAQPELTRIEYLRLLTTARALNKERLYLLIKLFGCTGIPLQELSRITVEALTQERQIIVQCCGAAQPLRLPDFFRQELLSYARRKRIIHGPIFCTKHGKPLSRTFVTENIKRLCRDACVPEEKANPRCLKHLWQKTQDDIRIQVAHLVEQAYDRLMEAEQLTVGWDAGKEVREM